MLQAKHLIIPTNMFTFCGYPYMYFTSMRDIPRTSPFEIYGIRSSDFFYPPENRRNRHREIAMNETTVLSVGLVYCDETDYEFVQKLQQAIDSEYKYYEIIIGCNPSDYDSSFVHKICEIKNTNIFYINENTAIEILRNNIFKQSIGDFVLYIEDRGIPFTYLLQAVEYGITNQTDSVRIRYDTIGPLDKMRDTCLSGLFFWVSGMKIDITVSYTGCYSRALINAVIAEETQNSFRIQLASLANACHVIPVSLRQPAKTRHWPLRKYIDIIGSIPHRLLYATSLLALCGVVGNILYAMYVIGVWLIVPNVQPGWTTASLLAVLQSSLLFFVIFLFSSVYAANHRAKETKRYFVSKTFSKNNFITSFQGINVENK